MKYTKTLLHILILLTLSLNLHAQTSDLIGYDAEGKLTYKADEKGNRIPDFSYVGYHHGEKEIPDVPVRKTISAIEGDNLKHLQNAINEMEALTPDANGYRGALLLKAGTYNVSNSIYIEKSGIVIRGEGQSTKLIATKTSKHDFIIFKGSAGARTNTATQKKVTNAYVPIGTQTVTVESGHGFKVGDRIQIERVPKSSWIDLLKMAEFGWTASNYKMKYKRIVTGVNGNKIAFDAPIVDHIDPVYANAYVYTYSWNGRIEEVGIENLSLESVYSSSTDENHAWSAVSFENVENGWAINVEAIYFAYSNVNINSSSKNISVISCKMLDHKSILTGARRYAFNVGGEQNLIKDCYVETSRHDFVTGSKVPGPNAFVNCTSKNSFSDIGPHHRWSTGQLYDNVKTNNSISVENRQASGTGHGWSGTSILFWNCEASKRLCIQDPPSDHRNWAIGCIGPHTNTGLSTTEPYGYIESKNINVEPFSLYEKQLADRLDNSKIAEFKLPSTDTTVELNYDSLHIKVIKSDSSVQINHIKLVINSTQIIRTDSVEPYEWGNPNSTYKNELLGLSCGIHTVQAIVNYDDSLTQHISMYLTVQNKSCMPIIKLLSPTTDTIIMQHDSIKIESNAFDNNGTINMVRLYVDDKLFRESNSAPFDLGYINTYKSNELALDIGNHSVKIIATNNIGLAADTSFQLTINPDIFNIPGKIEAENYLSMKEIDTEKTADTGGGLNVGWIAPGDWMDYNILVDSSANYIVSYRVASKANDIKLQLLVDNEVKDELTESTTGDFQKWVTYHKNIQLKSGEHKLKILATGSNWNINWIDFKIGALPQVSFEFPLEDTTISFDYTNLNIRANASDKDGSIKDVTLFIDNKLIRTDSIPPYLWGTNSEINNNELNSLQVGKHIVKVVATDNNGYKSKSEFTLTILDEDKLKIDEITKSGITIFPNPANDELNIEFSNSEVENSEVEVYNTAGKRVISQHISISKPTINIKQLKAGIYMLKVNQNKNAHIERFVKK